LKELCIELTPAIASSLYVAIMTDTGRFSYSNTDADTFRIISDLVEAGANPVELTDQVYKEYSFRRATLFGKVLNSLESHRKGKIATIELPLDIVSALELKPHETDGFMDYIQGIRETDVSIFFKQFSPDAVKVSLRSRGKVDVRKIASHFDGGGHKFASGCTVYSDLEEAKKIIIKECVKQLLDN
jgi:phosphoesterase RecJ-like protein